MFTAAAALYEAASVARHQAWRRGLGHAVAAAVPLLISVALVSAFQYVDNSGSVIRIGLNPVSAKDIFFNIFLSMGPVLLIGGAGAYLAFEKRRADVWVMAPLVLTCAVFYFFIDVRDHQNVYVGWRVGHLLLMTTPVLFAIVFEH